MIQTTQYLLLTRLDLLEHVSQVAILRRKPCNLNFLVAMRFNLALEIADVLVLVIQQVEKLSLSLLELFNLSLKVLALLFREPLVLLLSSSRRTHGTRHGCGCKRLETVGFADSATIAPDLELSLCFGEAIGEPHNLLSGTAKL